jgi:hypothetical protein
LHTQFRHFADEKCTEHAERKGKNETHQKGNDTNEGVISFSVCFWGTRGPRGVRIA